MEMLFKNSLFFDAVIHPSDTCLKRRKDGELRVDPTVHEKRNKQCGQQQIQHGKETADKGLARHDRPSILDRVLGAEKEVEFLQYATRGRNIGFRHTHEHCQCDNDECNQDVEIHELERGKRGSVANIAGCNAGRIRVLVGQINGECRRGRG